MIERVFQRCLLRPEEVPPSQEDLRVIGAFNPGAAATDEGVTLLVRVAEAPAESRPGHVGLPRWEPATERVVIDWLREEEVRRVDQRVVIVRRTGERRLTSISHLVVACGRDGRSLDRIGPERFQPAGEEEEFGVEDPRLTRLEGRFYFTYVAVSRHGAATALASTRDFRSFERHGIVFPPENKDVVLFPERIDGRFRALHRPNPSQHFCEPEMWLASSPDLVHWGGHRPFYAGTEGWEAGRVGAGPPPVRTGAGWLAIYHGNDRRPGGSGVGRYAAGVLRLDLERPERILAHGERILAPETSHEREGFVPEVVFPTGIVWRAETVLVYYGAADEVTAVVEWRQRDLLAAVGIKAASFGLPEKP